VCRNPLQYNGRVNGCRVSLAGGAWKPVEASPAHIAAMRSLWLSSMERARSVVPVRLPDLKTQANGPVKATTGLGLPLCRGFASASGGWLALDESLGDGMTHFWCVLKSSETPTTSSPRFDWRSSQTVRTGSKSFFGGPSKRSSKPSSFAPSQCVQCCHDCVKYCGAVRMCCVTTDYPVNRLWRSRLDPKPSHLPSRCSVPQQPWKMLLLARRLARLCLMKNPCRRWKSHQPVPWRLTLPRRKRTLLPIMIPMTNAPRCPPCFSRGPEGI
jgi:hypothetical protein